jgi:UDP-GlcNAc:undecaprenyl-phosphate GlcNAc-1-phosphate transferase
VFDLAAFLAALILSLFLTRWVRNFAIARGWTLSASSSHHTHTAAVPRLGGAAILLSFAIVTCISVPLSRMVPHAITLSYGHLFGLAGPGLLVFALGLYDDFLGVGPYGKLAVEALAACMLYMGGFGIANIPFIHGGAALPAAVNLGLTVLWVLGITNAFNLLDGLDGLAAGSALFSTVVVLLVAMLNGRWMIAGLASALAGATLGFLRYNFNPATIFLGDSGSLFIGFMLSAMSLASAAKSTTLISVAIPLVSFGLPMVDTVVSVLRRFLSGKPLFVADHDHIHHKLLKRGFSHRQVVIALYGVTAAFGAVSLLLLFSPSSTIAVVLIATGAVVVVGVQQLGYHEFFELGRVAKRTIDQKSVIVNNLKIRRAIEQLDRADVLEDVAAILRTAFENNEFDSFSLQLYSQARHYDWQRAEEAKSAMPAWQLTLELQSPDGIQSGHLHLRRLSVDRPLMVDINLLTCEFSKALGAAAGRLQDARPLVASDAQMAGSAGVAN